MPIKLIDKVFYQTTDGSEFETEVEARAHEKSFVLKTLHVLVDKSIGESLTTRGMDLVINMLYNNRKELITILRNIDYKL